MAIMIIERAAAESPEGCNRAASEVSCTVVRKKMDMQKREQQEAEYLRQRKMRGTMRL